MANEEASKIGDNKDAESGNEDPDSIRIQGMQFSYETECPLFLDFSLKVGPGSRCLLVGANGSGKTTLLKIMAGKHMVGGKDVVRVLNRSAFHDTKLVCSGDLAYLGGSWSKTVGSAGSLHRVKWWKLKWVYLVSYYATAEESLAHLRINHSFGKKSGGLAKQMGATLRGEIPLQGDFSAEHMIFGVEGADPGRRDKLIDLLDIDLHWRMHKVSDGQRRRVQICMGLLHPFKVLLLDEVTVDLDVVARMDLLDFFKEECEQRGATIVYTTHIFDGLETWATHLAYIQDGELRRSEKLSQIDELRTSPNLLSVVESWLRTEVERGKKKPPANPVSVVQSKQHFGASPFMSSRHMAYYR